MLNLHQIRFLKSASQLRDLPPDTGIEIAFVGRSNAGKSSALNTLTQQKKLARISKTPGRTQLINLFELSEQLRLVDLPGYGYAKVSYTIKEQWQKLLTQYLEKRKCLAGLILIMDVRHPLKEFDTNMVNWALAACIPVHVLLTKADKLSLNQAKKNLFVLERYLKDTAHLYPTVATSCQLFSSLTKIGVDDAQEKITQWFEKLP